MGSRFGVRGFTAIELGIALFIIVLIGIASVPAMSKYIQDYRLDGSTSNLVSVLNLCKQKAVSEGNDYIVAFDPVNSSYTILDDDNGNGGMDQGEHVVGPVGLPDGVTLQSGPNLFLPEDEFILYRDGTANANGMITLRNKNGGERFILVLSATGSAKKLRQALSPEEL